MPIEVKLLVDNLENFRKDIDGKDARIRKAFQSKIGFIAASFSCRDPIIKFARQAVERKLENDTYLMDMSPKEIEKAARKMQRAIEKRLRDNARRTAKIELENDTYLMDMSREQIEKAAGKIQRAIKKRLREGEKCKAD